MYDKEYVIRFNSKLVRLKGAPAKMFVDSTSGFQFQTGAIKSDDARTALKQSYAGFNSKLVRLKVRVDDTVIDIELVSIPNWCD